VPFSLCNLQYTKTEKLNLRKTNRSSHCNPDQPCPLLCISFSQSDYLSSNLCYHISYSSQSMPAHSQVRATEYFCNVTISQLQSSCFCEVSLQPGNLSKASPGYVLESIVWLNVQLQYKSYQYSQK